MSVRIMIYSKSDGFRNLIVGRARKQRQRAQSYLREFVDAASDD
jgi:hypothetical protein